MSASTTFSCSQYAAIAVINKRARCYYSHEVIVAFTAPSTTAMRNLRLALLEKGLLKDQWYHLNVFSAVTVEIARLSSSSFQDIESNSQSNIVFLESSEPSPELTAAILDPGHLSLNNSTVNILGRFVIRSPNRVIVAGETEGIECAGIPREALVVRRRTTIWGWAALLGAGTSGSVLIGVIVGYATHSFIAGVMTMGVLVPIVAVLESFGVWASKHNFL